MRRYPENYTVALLTRWGAWLLVVALLGYMGAFSRPTENSLALVLLSYTTLYAVLWTRRLRHIIRWTNDGSIIILYDLILSSVPVLLSGGWASPFLPFALSVLIVPTISRGLRAGLYVAATFLAIDQIILWTAWLFSPNIPHPVEIANSGRMLSLAGREMIPLGSIELLGRTLLPFGVVTLVAATARSWIWYYRYAARRRRTDVDPDWRTPAGPPSFSRPAINRPLTYGRIGPNAPHMERSLNKTSGVQSTVLRRSSLGVEAALRVFKPELESAGVVLITDLEGDERLIPPQVLELLTRAVEVGLDNVILHAHAQSVAVSLRINNENVSLRIVDDGVGLFDGTAEPPGFHQLKRLRYRVAELDGEMRVEECAEGGVRMELHVPLAA
jgi:hypothetical protein